MALKRNYFEFKYINCFKIFIILLSCKVNIRILIKIWNVKQNNLWQTRKFHDVLSKNNGIISALLIGRFFGNHSHRIRPRIYLQVIVK